MSLNSTFLDDLCQLKARGALDRFASVIEIGAQQLSNDFLGNHERLSECYRLFRKARPVLGVPIASEIVSGLEHLSRANPHSREFWRSLGFAYASIELDGHCDSIVLDLNFEEVPQRLRSAFDLVVNTGTTEHVANQDNAFRIMHDLCGVGGIMYHHVPAGGMMTHGLVTYTPKFFWHLCRENSYEPITLRVSAHPAAEVPQDIRDSNLRFAGFDPIDPGLEIPNFMVAAALRKLHDKPFVTPLDIPLD